MPNISFIGLCVTIFFIYTFLLPSFVLHYVVDVLSLLFYFSTFLGIFCLSIFGGICLRLLLADNGTYPIQENIKETYKHRQQHQQKSGNEQTQAIPLRESVHRDALVSSVSAASRLDGALLQILDLFIRDYIEYWCRPLSYTQQPALTDIKADLWKTVVSLKKRLSSIDPLVFLSQDCVAILCTHLKEIREAQSPPAAASTKDKYTKTPVADYSSDRGNKKGLFRLHYCLQSKELELEFLRRVSNFLLLILLPTSYSNCSQIVNVLTEVLACSTLYTTIDLLCDPDYINQKLFSWLEYHEQKVLAYTKTYSYAATFEGFVKMINSCEDVENLKQMRYKILTEIMQATALQNLKTSSSMSSKDPNSPGPITKGELLLGRDLKKYLNQLKFAKSLCEKLIYKYGGSDYQQYVQMGVPHRENLPGKTVLSFGVIMSSSSGRASLRRYLCEVGKEREVLLDFWQEVEACKAGLSRADQHLSASVIYQRYLGGGGGGGGGVRKLLDKAVVRGMEAYLLGDEQITAFYQAQEVVQRHIEEKYYPPFLVSGTYQHLLNNKDYVQQDKAPRADAPGLESSISLKEQATVAHSRLSKVREMWEEKRHALGAMRKSVRPVDPKVIIKLEEEMERLSLARSQLESHIEKTNVWCDNVGQWSAQVHSVEFVEDATPCFVIVVHLMGTRLSIAEHSSTSGWIVSRTFTDLNVLHQQLSMIEPWVKQRRLPFESGLPFFKWRQKQYLEKSKAVIDAYLNDLLRDSKLCCSEALYTFLLPSTDCIKDTLLQSPSIKSQKSSIFSFTNMFRRSSSTPTVNPDEDDYGDDGSSLFLPMGYENKLSESSAVRDSIAEPLYRLIGEVFELRGMFKWLRRSLMTFVQITFGKSINKQIRDTMHWLLSDSMLLYYLQIFQDSLWPGGELAPPLAARSEDEKLRTRLDARKKFISNIPEALSSLVGQTNAEHGWKKVFDSLQSKDLNKHLFYSLLDKFLFTLCPELEGQRSSPSSDCVQVCEGASPGLKVEVKYQGPDSPLSPRSSPRLDTACHIPRPHF